MMVSLRRSRLSLVLLGSLLVCMLGAGLLGGPAAAEQAGSVSGRVSAASVDAGGAHTCALMTTGAVRCWGRGSFGQLGHDSRANIGDGGTDPSIETAGNVPVGGTATAIAAGGDHTCALLTTGAVRCWGYGGFGQLGHDSPGRVGDGGSDPSIIQAGNVPLGGKATAITAGESHTCALLTTGAVRCWGNGDSGQLGHDSPAHVGDGGTDASIETAGDVPVGGQATAIAAGASHTCALLTTGAVRCWGYGGFGQLGHDSFANIGDGGTDPSIETAGDVPLDGTATAIAAGGTHTCALLTTGAVRCWGHGDLGQLGHDSATNVGDGGTDLGIAAAGDVPLGAKASAVTAGIDHTCALLTTGAVRCWGRGFSGQLGHDSHANIGDGGTDPSIETAGDVPVGVPIRVRAATRVTATVTPKRDRHAPYVYALTGRVTGAFVADGATCTGQVKVTVRRSTKVLRTRSANVDSGCRYRTRVRLTGADLPLRRATRLTAKIRYLGTTNLASSQTARHLTAH